MLLFLSREAPLKASLSVAQLHEQEGANWCPLRCTKRVEIGHPSGSDSPPVCPALALSFELASRHK